VMTATVQKAQLWTPVSSVVKMMLFSHFTGIPVVDENDRPQGVISQGDLIYRARMPLRLGILAAACPEKMDGVMQSLSQINAEKIMTRPAVCISEERPLVDAVELMLKKILKRLPVVDAAGKLTGIISRQDIFHTATQERPDWTAFHKQDIQVMNMRFVSDIMRRDVHTVFPDTSIMDIIHIIDTNDVQRVAVIDADGIFLGMISDKDIFSAFSEQSESLWDLFVRKLPLLEKNSKSAIACPDIINKTARDIMHTHCITVLENTSIDEAISLIMSLGIKRLPVLDILGKFKGLISRESLMRIGFESKLAS